MSSKKPHPSTISPGAEHLAAQPCQPQFDSELEQRSRAVHIRKCLPADEFDRHVLFLRQPLGPAPSVLLALGIMFGHRFVAAPWAYRHAVRRCAWCARRVDPPVPLDVTSGGARRRLASCSIPHGLLAARFLTFTRRWRWPIAAGIAVPLAVLVVTAFARSLDRPVISHGAAALQFRLVVALVVVVASIAYRSVDAPDAELASPFPLHNLLLLGIRQTLWVFRLVGAWWLLDGVRRLFG